MKLLGNTERKITKDKNGENVPHLQTTELVLVHCNLVNNDYQQDSYIHFIYIHIRYTYYIHLFQTNHLVVY